MRTLPAALPVALPVTLAAGLVVAGLSTAAPAEAVERSVSFASTGAEQAWVVPTGVTSIVVTATGGRGGSGEQATAGERTPGGLGAQVTARLAVTPGQSLYVLVGGDGAPFAGEDTASGGFNGGGASDANQSGPGGGGGYLSLPPQYVGGGGGGAGSSGAAAGATEVALVSPPATSAPSVVISWTLADPDTTITKAPKKKSAKKKAKVVFNGTAGATFECSLDGKPFAACSSPYKAKVKRGKHTVSVRAVLAGVPDPTPATARFKVVKRGK